MLDLDGKGAIWGLGVSECADCDEYVGCGDGGEDGGREEDAASGDDGGREDWDTAGKAGCEAVGDVRNTGGGNSACDGEDAMPIVCVS